MDKVFTQYLHDTYTDIDILKDSSKSKIIVAFNKISKQVCAIKHLHNNKNGLLYQQLKNIKHSILPQIYYVHQDAAELLVIEEYLNGQSLADYLRQKKILSDNEIEAILLQLCKGLAVLHKMKIIHRDIKLENIIITTDNIVKLIDFDIARIVKETETHDTTYLGTRGYAAPEQYGYAQTDIRSDIYAIGATLAKLHPKAERLQQIIAKAMQIDPNYRYQSTDEIVEELESAYQINKPADESILEKFETVLRQKLELFYVPEPIQARDYPYIKDDYFILHPPSLISTLDYASHEKAKNAAEKEFERTVFVRLTEYIVSVLDDYRMLGLEQYYSYQRSASNFYHNINQQVEKLISETAVHFNLKLPDYIRRFECIPSYTLLSGEADKQNHHLWRLKHLHELPEYIEKIKQASFERIMRDTAAGFFPYINIVPDTTTEKYKRWFSNEYKYREVTRYAFNIDEASEMFVENILESAYLIMFNNHHLQEDVRELITQSYIPEFKQALKKKIAQIMEFLAK